MLSLACDLWCKVRLAKKCNLGISSRLSCWRNYAANNLNFGSQDLTSKPKFVPIGGASFVQNLPGATRDVPEILSGFDYSSIIYRALFIEGSKALEAGANVLDLNEGTDAAHDKVLAYLKSTAQMVRTPKEIAQVTAAVANGDGQLGSCIAKVLQKIGKDGLYIVDECKERNNDVDFVNALSPIKRRFCSPITNNRKKICLLDNPFILILVNKVLDMDVIEAVEQALGSANCKQQRPLLISAENVDREVESYCFWKKIKVCVIEPRRRRLLCRATWREMMEDLAVLTGGQVAMEESDMNFMKQILGSCKKVIVSEEMLLIHDASGDQKDIEKRCEKLRSAIELHTASDHLKERIELLSQKARFKVDKAIDCYKVSRAVSATQSAMQNGILPGDGVALLNASKELDELQPTNSDMKLGIQFLQNALKMPVYYIAHAAGFDGSVAVEKLLEQVNPDLGYHSATGEYIEMIKSGKISRVDEITRELETAMWLFKQYLVGRDLQCWELAQKYVHVE